jgi:hypothetical protein
MSSLDGIHAPCLMHNNVFYHALNKGQGKRKKITASGITTILRKQPRQSDHVP